MCGPGLSFSVGAVPQAWAQDECAEEGALGVVGRHPPGVNFPYLLKALGLRFPYLLNFPANFPSPKVLPFQLVPYLFNLLGVTWDICL